MSDRPRELPGLDCGLCGHRSCGEFAAALAARPDLLTRCIHLDREAAESTEQLLPAPPRLGLATAMSTVSETASADPGPWQDSLGRPYDFVLRHFPEDPGPREVIRPHNPMLTREMEISAGDLMLGRPMGMSCGCPITHCGVVTDVDRRTGIVIWCITGPLRTRREGFKDIGYYSAEAYEGLVLQSRVELIIGARYFFQPQRCMLQWRHSGLINYLSRGPDGLQVRLEGLWIG